MFSKTFLMLVCLCFAVVVSLIFQFAHVVKKVSFVFILFLFDIIIVCYHFQPSKNFQQLVKRNEKLDFKQRIGWCITGRFTVYINFGFF